MVNIRKSRGMSASTLQLDEVVWKVYYALKPKSVDISIGIEIAQPAQSQSELQDLQDDVLPMVWNTYEEGGMLLPASHDLVEAYSQFSICIYPFRDVYVHSRLIVGFPGKLHSILSTR